jgi:hypothetical protein
MSKVINFIKSIIPNVIFFTGYFIMIIGTTLHKLLNTNTGKQIRLLEAYQDQVRERILTATEEFNTVQKAQPGSFFVKSKGSDEVH